MKNRRRAIFFAAAAAASLPLAAQADWTPTTLFAPYVDMSSWPTPKLTTLYTDSGTSHYTLAFITATDSTNTPAWGGVPTYAAGSGDLDAGINSGIATLRSHGGDVGISFGGQSGTDLANVVSAATLQSDYQNVLNTYNVHRVDFDIEGNDPANHTAVDNRFTAIHNIQAAAPAATPLAVTLTLAVEPTKGTDPNSGLSPDALYTVKSAISHGVNISSINLMTMQFGDYFAPPGGDMGDYVINAAQTAFSQLKTIYNGSKTDAQIYAMLGITPMIGMNSSDETFTTADANKVGMWAAQHQVGLLSFWLATRDHAGSGSSTSELDSGIAQTDYQFAHIFQTWANAIPGDANNDGIVTFADFVALSNDFGLANKGWAGGDFNGDGTTSFADFVLLSNNFGQSIPGSNQTVSADDIAAFQSVTANFAASPVPEPATALLLLPTLLLLRRRQKPHSPPL